MSSVACENVGDLIEVLQSLPKDTPVTTIVGSGRKFLTADLKVQVAQRQRGSNVIVDGQAVDDGDDTETVVGISW